MILLFKHLICTGLFPDLYWDNSPEGCVQASTLRDIFANPFSPVTIDSAWPTWNDGTVRRIAESIYEERAFDRMPILADALEDAGCDNTDILSHCRYLGPHVRGCWVVDLVRSVD